MHSLRILLFIASHIVLFASENEKQLPTTSDLFHEFDKNLLNSFSNGYGLYHVSAIGLSYVLIESGTDWDYWLYMQDHKSISYAGFGGVIVGGLVPLTVPLILYLSGKSDNDARLMYTGLALGQAAISSLLVTSAYKAITGRKYPNDEKGTEIDFSKDFNFGFMRRGIFNGWPSGHTTNAFAMTTVMWQMYPDNNYIKALSAVYASFIGLSVSTNIHWFSDFVAGALIGISIGNSIGQSFKDLPDGKRNDRQTNLFITPTGVHFSWRF